MADFYHIYIDRKADASAEDVTAKMNLALDWFRYGTKTWIVFSSSNAAKWYARLKPLVHPEGTVFVCKLDVTDMQGWMDRRLWDWLRDHKS
jgi:hypothetical protein